MRCGYFNKILWLPLVLLCPSVNVNAQLLPKLTKTINESASMISSVGKLVDASKRTAADFNKSVTVTQGHPTTPVRTTTPGGGTTTTTPAPPPPPPPNAT